MPLAANDEERHARRMKAIELRQRGKSYPEIARELGCSIALAYSDVNYRLKQIIAEEKEATEDLRQLELDRLDKLADGIWDTAIAGNLDAIETYLKIQSRRAKLTGLDAPTKVEVTPGANVRTREEIYNRVRELNKRLAAAGVKVDPIIFERSPFEADRMLKSGQVIEGEVLESSKREAQKP